MIKEVVPNLFLIKLSSFSCNVYLLQSGKNVLIDSGLFKDRLFLEDELSNLDIKPEDISYVLHTHGHADHIGGDALFGSSEKWMSKEDGELVNSQSAAFSVSEWFSQDYFPKINNFYSPEQVFNFGEFNLQVINTPGHTKGGVSFFDAGKQLLFSGDTLFNKSVGRHDLISSNKDELLRSVEKLSNLDFSFLLPGHGDIRTSGMRENFEIAFSMLR